MCKPTCFEPVKEMNRVFGLVVIASPVAELPVTKFTTPGGRPTSSTISINFAAIVGESDDGLSTTVFPVTTAAIDIPDMMASGKFQGGMIAPTPSGMYSSELCSPSILVTGCFSDQRSISRP